MTVMVCIAVTILICGFGWYIESRMALSLTPFVIFSVYFILRVIPGFTVGIHRYDLDPLYAAMMPVACSGFFLGYFSSRRPHLSEVGVWTAIARSDSKSSYEWRIAVFAVIVLAAGLALYRGVPPSIATAFDLARGSVDTAEAAQLVSDARRAISKGHIFEPDSGTGSGVFRELIFVSSLLLLSMAAVYAFALPGYRSIVALIASTVLTYVFVSGDGTRGRFVVVITSLFIAYTLFRHVRLRHVAIGFVSLLGLSAFLGIYTNKMISLVAGEAWGEIVQAVLERIFIGNSINDATAIAAVEAGFVKYGFGHWLTRDLIALMPGISADKPLAYYLYLFDVGGDSTTYLTGTSLSRAFVDGWLPGVFVYFALLGFIAALSGTVVKALPNLSVGARLGLMVALWVAAGQCYVSGVAGVLFLVGMCIALALILGFVIACSPAYNSPARLLETEDR